MSCDRRCFDESSESYGHDDCHTCPGRDGAPERFAVNEHDARRADGFVPVCSSMSDTEQMQVFSNDLDRLVRRYRQEFDISFGAVIAALEMRKFTLCAEAAQSHGEGE